MKKKGIAVILTAAMMILSLSGSVFAKEETEKKELTPLTLNEVAHSIFYAPQYAAIELGYFEEEGIDLTLVTGFGVSTLGQDRS